MKEILPGKVNEFKKKNKVVPIKFEVILYCVAASYGPQV